MELGLKGKHVFITGASGGIGLETARLFLKEGSNVTLHYATKKDPLNDLLNEFPNNTFSVQASATDEASVSNSIRESVQKFGVIHVMIANHAIFPAVAATLKDMSVEQFKNTLDVNLVGIFLFVREWLRILQDYVDTHKTNELEGVNCVIVGSTSGLFGEAGHIDYSCSKSALTYGFTKTMKNEIPNIIKNARVNVVAPGWVLTAMAQRLNLSIHFYFKNCK